MFTYILYALALSFWLFSSVKDPARTKRALRKSWKAFSGMLPEFSGVLVLVGLILTLLTPSAISRFIGSETGFLGMLFTGIVGAITLIPGFVAFPMASSLLQSGAGIMQISVFIATLMMVGVVTAPLEITYFGRRQTLLRNGLSFCFAYLIAFILGVMVG